MQLLPDPVRLCRQPPPRSENAEARTIAYKGNEAAWKFVNKPWETNDAGDMIVPGRRNIGLHLAFNTERAYRDCVVSGKFQMSWVPFPQLIVRSLDSHRFYAVLFSLQFDYPDPPMVNVDSPWLCPLMVSIWKSGADGYQRMVTYRRKASYIPSNHRDRWFQARVECVGPEIIVFLDDNFICAIRDEEYKAGLVGVGSVFQGGVWRDLTVEGQPVELKIPWKLVPKPAPAADLIQSLNLLPSRGTVYLPSTEEWWKYRWGMTESPNVRWTDNGTNYDDLTIGNFPILVSRSKDGGKTWSAEEKANLPFPEGQVYKPIKGKAAAVLVPSGRLAELSDGSIGWSVIWCNGPDGHYQATQLLFYRSTDGGESWSMSPIDAGEWERNESQWVECSDGELLCVSRSNMNTHLGISRSTDKGRTWSRIRPALPFYGANGPSLLRTRDNIVILFCRGWGLFTSVDKGQTWSLPIQSRIYTGDESAMMVELPDGRILVGSRGRPDDSQLIRIDRDGVIHPANKEK